MLPFISFSYPRELRPVGEPMQCIMDIDPCIILFSQAMVFKAPG